MGGMDIDQSVTLAAKREKPEFMKASHPAPLEFVGPNTLEKQRSSSVLFKHKENEHKHETMKITMKITKKFKDPLTRQANEAVRITNRNECKGELLNSKTEFHHPPISRIVVEKSFKKKMNHHSKPTLN